MPIAPAGMVRCPGRSRGPAGISISWSTSLWAPPVPWSAPLTASTSTTSWSDVGEKSMYHPPIAKNGSGVSNATTSSASRDSAVTVSGGATGTARGEAVVDDDHRSTRQRDGRAATSQAGRPPLHLGPLPGLDLGQLGIGDARLPQDLRIEDADAALADRAHSQLR